MRFLLRPAVRAFVRSSLPDRLSAAASRVAVWASVQRAYLVSPEEGLLHERAVHYLDASHAAVDWWASVRVKSPTRHASKVCRSGDGKVWFEPPVVDARFRKELAKRCVGRSSWV